MTGNLLTEYYLQNQGPEWLSESHFWATIRDSPQRLPRGALETPPWDPTSDPTARLPGMV